MHLLTHLPLVPHICVVKQGQHLFRWWLVACSAPSHYLNQCWIIVNWTLRNKLQWNFDWNSNIFIKENALENRICEMAAILSKGRWVNYVSLYLLCIYAWEAVHFDTCYCVIRVVLWWGLPSPACHCWNYHPGTLSCDQVSATHMKIGHP